MHIARETRYNPFNNCTQGFFLHNDTTGAPQWYPGTCEADIICQTHEDSIGEPCESGYVCDERTTALSAALTVCAGGYVCGVGTTPDIDLHAPSGQYNDLCDEGYFCQDGTGVEQQFRSICPRGFFCPTGTLDPLYGIQGHDSILRGVSGIDADPFYDMGTELVQLPGLRLSEYISAHDQRCFDGVDEDLQDRFRFETNDQGQVAALNLATEADLRCGRDHHWRMIH